VVSYANQAKEQLLGVERAALEQHGAVSEVVARQMARRVRERLGADIGISITGVAGPDGGTPDKPVGLVWIGLSDAQGDRAERFLWNEDRSGNRLRSVEAALRLLIQWAQQR
jgi:PncC family amidohydrolase